jgi:hypothetical protein
MPSQILSPEGGTDGVFRVDARLSVRENFATDGPGPDSKQADTTPPEQRRAFHVEHKKPTFREEQVRVQVRTELRQPDRHTWILQPDVPRGTGHAN